MVRNQALDSWRGCAIVSLLVGHFVPGFGTSAPAWGINFGRLGVELFFALSGCLMGGILFQQGMPLREFAARRFSRIVPSMWVFIAAAAIVGTVRHHDSLATAVAAALGLLNLFDANAYALRLAHLWSVCLELQGYAVLALVAFVVRRRRWAAPAVIATIVAASVVATMLRPAASYHDLFLRPEHRLTSMLLAAALVSWAGGHAERIARLPPWPLALAAGVLLQIVAVPDAVKYTAGAALLATACARVAVAPDRLASALTARWLVAFGAASYSIYLWQQLMYFERRAIPWPLAFALATCLGFAAHHVWDQRLHRWVLRMLVQRPKALSQSAASGAEPPRRLPSMDKPPPETAAATPSASPTSAGVTAGDGLT
jgi:peptidoglycan/LPS O-acetylase OafA/YrhL